MSNDKKEKGESEPKSKSRKVLKIVLWTVGVIVIIPIVLLLALPLWLGPIARPCVNAVAPKFTKTSFEIGHLYANPYTGRFELGDFTLGNPKGYDEPTLIAISNLVFDLDVDTMCDKSPHIEEIIVDGLFVSIVKGGENNVDNIVQLQYNLAGGKEKYEAKQAKAKEAAAADKEKSEADAKAEAEAEKAKLEAMSEEERKEYLEEQEAMAAAEEAAKKKFVIDRVVLRNIKVKYGMITLPVPSIELHDLGKESDGVTMGEFFTSVWQAILKGATAIGDGAKALGGMIGDGASAAGEVIGDGAKAIGDGAGKAVDAIGDGAGKAVDAIGDGAGAAVDAVKGWFK